MINLHENFNREKFDLYVNDLAQSFIKKLKLDDVLFTTDERSLRVWYDDRSQRTNEYGWYALMDCPKKGSRAVELDYVNDNNYYQIASAISIPMNSISISQALHFIPLFCDKVYDLIRQERKNASLSV